jgi:hypothetical protein
MGWRRQQAAEENVQWEIEVRRFGLTGDRHKAFRSWFAEILRQYDGKEIAKLAAQLTWSRISESGGLAKTSCVRSRPAHRAGLGEPLGHQPSPQRRTRVGAGARLPARLAASPEARTSTDRSWFSFTLEDTSTIAPLSPPASSRPCRRATSTATTPTA